MIDKELEFMLKDLIRKHKAYIDMQNTYKEKGPTFNPHRTALDIVNESKWLDVKKYANIRGLNSFVEYNPQLSQAEVEKLIKSKPLTFKFLNHLLKIMPDTFDLMKEKDLRGFLISYVSRCNALELSKKVCGKNYK